MKIGHIDFKRYPLFLAPMENVTDPSFRYMCKQFGADMVYTEFVSSDGLIRDAYKSLEKLKINDGERPAGIQIYGHLIENMIEAAKIAEQSKPDLIDINFGCPVKKIAGRGAGSGMMKEPDKMVEITRQVVNAVNIPVTVKTRLGWDDDSRIIVDLAEKLQDAGIAALTIHGRTRTQLYKGVADWSLIGEVKKNRRIHIPVIGNGDIDSPEIAKERFHKYEIDAIMIGRATYGCPWIFRNIKRYLEKGELLPEPDVDERVGIAKMHLLKSIEVKGERVGVLEMRRHLSSYFKGLNNFKDTKLKLVTENDPQKVLNLLDYIGIHWGNGK
ncbi:MAG: tRNA dihydrouridine synthase DusB [Prevotellaceae bacterium]|jgi:nifR3 family TIM-barrel protein|nr:tRNA dihydrouridine synthase DusB [Prevotellaceae bacterium]